MRALRGVSLIEVLAALAITAILLSLLISFLFQLQVSQKFLNKIDSTQNAVQRNLVPFLASRLVEVALVQGSINQSSVEFELTPRSLTFVSRFLPPSPHVGLQRVSVTDLGDGGVEISISDWPGAISKESVFLSGVTVEFRADHSNSMLPNLPSAVLMVSNDQEFKMPLGSELPVTCVFSITRIPEVDRCGGLEK